MAEHNGVEGSGETTYYGRRAVTVDSLAPAQYRLRDPSRGDGNAVYFDSLGGHIDHDSRDFGAEVAAVALDVQWGTAAFYDMMEARFGWLGLDGEGKSLEAVVYSDPEDSFVNAYWNGVNAAFGNGDCHYTPLTAIDVVAHEFVHGVTDYTSDLVYSEESGALNEAMSDIFGKALEHEAYPEGFTWEIGAQFSQSPYARSFRSMSDPHERDHPKYYRGENWNEWGAVHTNSSVLNHWFYLLVEGGAGTDETGRDFDVAALGWDAALEHVFAMQRDYLTPDAGYRDAYAYSLEIAEADYGAESTEYAAIAEAWAAVGLSDDAGPRSEYDNYLVPELDFGRVFFACHSEDGLVVPITVTNAGNRVLEAGEVIVVDVEDDFGDRPPFTLEIELDAPLAFGQSLSRDVATDRLTEPGEPLIIGFEIPSNDYDVPVSGWTYFFDAPRSDDAPLSVYLPRFGGVCAWDTLDYFVGVYNASCSGETQAPETGTVFLLDEYGTTLRKVPFQTPDLEFYDIHWVDFEYAASALAEVTGYRVEFGSGITAEEEELSPRAALLPSKLDLYDIGLDTDYDLAEDVAVEAFSDLGIVEYRGKPYWGTVGEYPLGIAYPCAEATATLRSNWTDGFSFCADFSAAEEVAVSAEVLRLSSVSAAGFADIGGNFSVVSFHHRDAEGRPVSSVHGGLPDRSPERVGMTLPAGYRGAVGVEVYNYLGEGDWGFDGTFRDSSDYTLMRNLRFETQVVNTAETGTQTAQLAPNPATATAQLTLGEADRYDLHVVDALGRTVLRSAFEGATTDLDVRAWAAGLYTVEAIGERSGRRWRGRLVR